MPFETLCQNIPATAREAITLGAEDTLCSFTMAGKPVRLMRLGSDMQLTHVIAKELSLRGALPSKEHGHTILLAEHDTEYGLGMVKAFRKSIEEQLRTDRRSGDAENVPGFLHVLWFARGLDGYTSSAQQARPPTCAARRPRRRGFPVWRAAPDRGHGTRQRTDRLL
ncbi:MAG: hypothetical protein HC888_06390 [Candidatus Competibacteraceae bacterium]|nr:hypothetical protein [Candidatus Competibacteraceae bacterium]